jgi:hypothetical protein
MRRSSLPLSWIMKHRFGFLAQMWRQQEPLLLLKGGYWTLRSLPGWYTDVEVVAEADKQGYLTKMLTLTASCLDGRSLTCRGETFASDLVLKIPPATKARSRSKNAPLVSKSSAPKTSELIEPSRPPVLTSKALELLRRVETHIFADPNCFTLRACCESIPAFKARAFPERYPKSGIISCLAGTTCLCIARENGTDPARFINRLHSELAAIAASELGLAKTEGHRLFAHWSFDFLTLYRHSNSAHERACVVIKRIERFIETGE